MHTCDMILCSEVLYCFNTLQHLVQCSATGYIHKMLQWDLSILFSGLLTCGG